ncbi:uncharacterized protein LOC113210950 [Frankliniella occidentalis]|uniref:Uncharacterized protein LOC113210950 n=1 Tax=Frankliniella occidentalis TaxID=133901 RepID=A0A6J1SUI4_FRAOC|nr:uncharacterized protein LOC113210950 [Frankliniella occidentalis]
MEQVREEEGLANAIGETSNTDPAHNPHDDPRRDRHGIGRNMTPNHAAAAPIPIPPNGSKVFVGADYEFEEKELYYKACSEHTWALDRPEATNFVLQQAFPAPPPSPDPRQVMQVTTATGHDVRFLMIGDSYISCLRAPTEDQCMPLFTVHHLPPNRHTPQRSKKYWIGSDRVKAFHRYYKDNHDTNKGHSVPYGDMSTIDSRKRTMEMPYNIYPTKRTVNSGNMQAVEEAIRKFVDGEGGEGLVVISGHIGVLHQRDESEYMPMYFFKMLLRSPTFGPIPMGCILMSNNAGEIAEARLPKGGKKPKWIGNKVKEREAAMGITRFVEVREFFHWAGKHFPEAITPQIVVENMKVLVDFLSPAAQLTAAPRPYRQPLGLLQERNLTEVIDGQGSPPAC